MRSGLSVHENFELKRLNTFGVPALARYFAAVDDVEALRGALADKRFAAMPRLILGGGSNLLLTRDFPGLVINIRITGRRIVARDGDATYVEAGAGENWHDFVSWTLDRDLSGLENLSLIPGSVGAGPIQNIGAYGVELKETFHELIAADTATGETFKLDAGGCRFGYRDSVFKHELKDRAVITRVVLRLPHEVRLHLDYGEVRQQLAQTGISRPSARDVADAVIAIRRAKLPDPAVIGNAGSFFKNPVVTHAELDALLDRHPKLPHYPAPEGRCKLAAAWLIEAAGWKGRSMGRAGVHDRHALVLVNRGGATGAEIVALADAIRESVLERFGIALEPEPVIV